MDNKAVQQVQQFGEMLSYNLLKTVNDETNIQFDIC